MPSALQLIIVTFPDPVEQSQAVALFAGTAGIGNSKSTIDLGAYTAKRLSSFGTVYRSHSRDIHFVALGILLHCYYRRWHCSSRFCRRTNRGT